MLPNILSPQQARDLISAMQPQQLLENEYLQRRHKNQAYSLRSFSRMLDLPSGRVSQLLNRKRNFTPKLGLKIASKLGLDPLRTQEFLGMIENEKRHRCNIKPALPPRELSRLPMDQFEAIADPVHFSILSLLETKGFSGSLRDVAAELGIDVVEARACADRLVRLDLARFNSAGNLRLAKAPGVATSQDVQNAALRRAHKRVLEESIAALEDVAVELRDITSITMAVDPSRIPEAKEKIRLFRRSLSEFLESGSRTEVYRLNLQLIPVSKRKKR